MEKEEKGRTKKKRAPLFEQNKTTEGTKRQKEQTTERTKDAPKVADLHERPGRAVQQRVLQLNVPVDHAHAVAVVQPDDQLLKKPPRLVLAQPVLADDVFKHVAPAGKLHRDAEVVRGEEDLLELDDVGVDEAAVVDDLALDVLGDLFGFVCFFDLCVFLIWFLFWFLFLFLILAALCFFPSEHTACFLRFFCRGGTKRAEALVPVSVVVPRLVVRAGKQPPLTRGLRRVRQGLPFSSSPSARSPNRRPALDAARRTLSPRSMNLIATNSPDCLSRASWTKPKVPLFRSRICCRGRRRGSQGRERACERCEGEQKRREQQVLSRTFS